MQNSSFNYVRTHRKRSALTTTELTTLIGLKSATSVARVERGEREASLRMALALQVIFGPAPRELFPGLYEAVEDDIMRRGHALREALEGKDDPVSAAKRALVDEMATRSLANSIEL